MLYAIDGFALSVDRSALVDDRSCAPLLTDLAAESVDGAANGFAPTIDSAAL